MAFSADTYYQIQIRRAHHFLNRLQNLNATYEQGGDAVIRSLEKFDADWMQIRHAWTWLLKTESTPQIQALIDKYGIYGFRFIAYRLPHNEQIKWITASLEIAETLDNAPHIMIHLTNLGNVYRLLSKFELAKSHIRRALEIAEEQQNLTYSIINLIYSGWIAYSNGDYVDSVSCYEQAYALATQANDLHQQAESLSYLAVTCLKRGEYDIAEKHLQQAASICETTDNPRGLCDVYIHFGLLYDAKHELEKARSYLVKSLNYAKQLNIQSVQANIYLNLGLVASHGHDYDEAIYYYNLADHLYEVTQRITQRGKVLNNMGMVEMRRGHHEAAHAYFSRALVKKQDAGEHLTLLTTMANFAYTHARLGYFADSVEMMLEAIKLVVETTSVRLKFFILGYSIFLMYRLNQDDSFIKQALYLTYPLHEDKQLKNWIPYIDANWKHHVTTDTPIQLDDALMGCYKDIKAHQTSNVRA